MVIYTIKNKKNNKQYIGQTTYKFQYYIDKRKNQLNNNTYPNTHLQRSWNKYGEESFKFDVIEECSSIEDLNEREKYWIDKLEVLDSNKGYNVRLGGENFNFSGEGKKNLRKIHAKLSGKVVHQYDLNGTYIKTFQSIMQASRETGIADANIVKCAKRHKRYNKAGNYIWRYKKINNVSRYIHGNSKGVIQFDRNNNKIDEFDTLQKAAEKVCGHASNIQKACKGELKTAYGYKWQAKNL